MRKKFKYLIVICILFLVILSNKTYAQIDKQYLLFRNDEALSFENILYNKTIDNGDKYGIVDFKTFDGDVVLLNNANNNLYKINNLGYNLITKIEDFDSRKFTINNINNEIVIWGYKNGLSSLKLFNIYNDKFKDIEIPHEYSEAVLDLSYINNSLYLVVSNEGEILTHEFRIDDENLVFTRTLKGQVIDSQYCYYDKIDKSSKFKRDIIIDSYTDDLKDAIVLNIERELPIISLQLLGKENDLFIIKSFEDISSISDEMIFENIIYVDIDSNIVKVVPISENLEKLDSKLIKIDNGKLKQLEVEDNEIKLNSINQNLDLLSKEYEEYIDSYKIQKIENDKIDFRINNVNSIGNATKLNSRLTGEDIINNAKMYHANFNWYCSSENLKGGSCWVRPAQLNTANTTYSMMPYARNRWNTPSDFINEMNNGVTAGQASSHQCSNTAGIDCSGLVSRAWELPRHTGTKDLPSISTRIEYSDLRKGDILNSYNKHVIIFESINNGVVTCYESTYNSSWGRVAHTTKYLSTLQNNNYIPYRKWEIK